MVCWSGYILRTLDLLLAILHGQILLAPFQHGSDRHRFENCVSEARCSTVIPILMERPACRYDWCGEKVLDMKVG
jgi:hypothetical protein